MKACRRLGRLPCDADGSVLLETTIVLPVLMLFMMVITELSLMANAKQLANYAAFCAARTASVLGVDSTAQVHFAGAMAMSCISPQVGQGAPEITQAYGLQHPYETAVAICDLPGFEGDDTELLGRLAYAYVRMSPPTCDTGSTPDRTRRHVVVNVTYIYRCSIFPFGEFWGRSELNSYIAFLKGLSFYPIIASAVGLLENARPWNVPIHGRAVMDYWAS